MIKPHRKLRVTRRLLQTNLRACRLGLDTVRNFLPVTLSTDPVDNLRIAERLMDADQGFRTWWLVREANHYIKGKDVLNELPSAATHHWFQDLYILAQLLAIFADIMLSARGL